MFLKFQIFVFSYLLFFYSLSFAQLSPGKLHQVHKNLEGIENCTKCHERGKQLSGDRCLDCHELLKERIEQGKGLHANEEFKECKNCHIEHHGRDAELVYWKEGQENFDHSKTGYVLEGAHAALKCRDCHNEKFIVNKKELLDQKKDLNRTFLGLEQRCLSCHIDEHRGQLNENCLDCHVMKSWKPVPKFDHNKTRYKLTGRHKKVECQKCHKIKADRPIGKDNVYLDFKVKNYTRCVDCHKDPHQKKFGQKCEQCHTTNGWKEYNKKAFNHDLTAFPLRGKHQTVECKECHKSSETLKIARFQSCTDCHQDYHQGQFATSQSKGACEHCHTVNGFSPSTFSMKDHQSTNYPLKGAHQAVPCILCHKKINQGTPQETMQFRFKSTRCIDCHEDPHDNQLNKYLKLTSTINNMDGCEHCHRVERWDLVSFDHAITNFKLEGRHQKVACRECHKPDARGVFKFAGVPVKCEVCHEDVHLGQFKTASGAIECERCHTPQDWIARKFDHNRDSKFKLSGAHAKVPCNDCHKIAVQNAKRFVKYKPIPTSCNECHGKEIIQPVEVN